jgi:2'-hydroxyisoflavone reductase
MSPTRRVILSGFGSGLAAPGPGARAQSPLNILIIGGTGFTGPAQVDYALARGHRVTLMNRNRRGNLFADKVELLVGDLAGDISVLRVRNFDAVIDNPTTSPDWVRNVAQYLKGRVGHYIFISTVGVYADLSLPGLDETFPTKTIPAGVDPYNVPPDQRGAYYQALKSMAEREVETHYPGAATHVRSGLIVGPRDNTDNFLYWVARIARGGTVLAPGTPDDPAQVIDARDLGEWTIRLAETRTIGAFNAAGPAQPLTMGAMFDAIKAGTRSDARFEWVPASFLTENKLRQWADLPAWANPNGDWAGVPRVSIKQALAAGLTLRPLADTVKDAYAWHLSRPETDRKRTEDAARSGLSPAREKELLAAWAARQSAIR